MASDLYSRAADRAEATPGVSATVRGIVDDALELLRHQFAMLKAEIRADFRKLIAAIIPLASGIAPLILGLLMICLMCVHLLHWATLPAGQITDQAALPLWACYGIVGAVFALVGGALLALGVYRLKQINPLPDETARALEENIQWLMNKTPK